MRRREQNSTVPDTELEVLLSGLSQNGYGEQNSRDESAVETRHGTEGQLEDKTRDEIRDPNEYEAGNPTGRHENTG